MAALAPEPVNACEFHCIPPGMIWYAVLAALIDISNGDEVPTDVNTLMEEARCLECTLTPGLVPYSILTALQGLSSGGGLGTVQVYEGRDPAPPDDPTKAAINYPVGGGAITQWDGAAWV